MQANKADDEEVRQLIKERMDKLGVTLNDVAEQNPYLADRIKRGIVDDPTVFACAQALGLITHHKLSSGQIPSRDVLVALLTSETLSEWEKY